MNVSQFKNNTEHNKVYVSPGVEIDVDSLYKSSVNRYIVSMSLNEILRHSPNIKDNQYRPDTTGGVIIVSSFGMVDGFRKVKMCRDRGTSMNVTIFELRCAEYFMESSLDIAIMARNDIGRYNNNSMIGELRGGLDLVYYDHQYNHRCDYNVDKKPRR